MSGNDTLVIDTVGFKDKFWFDRRATPHTTQLHTIERWTRLDTGHLVREVTANVKSRRSFGEGQPQPS